MLKIVTIVGARPQFIKAAPVSRALVGKHREILVHTGQHYDSKMSGIFFDQLGVPLPDYNLEIGSGSHGAQTGAMLAKTEEVLLKEKPDLVIVYGDTNSTLAGALAAAKMQIPVAHIEAGIRSFNRAMPEELNRVLTDHLAQYLFCPTHTAVKNLAAEGITRGVSGTGDVMYDALLYFLEKADYTILEKLRLQPGNYCLATVHRPQNTDHYPSLRAIIDAFNRIGQRVIFPLHPRTRGCLKKFNLLNFLHDHITLIEPVGYLEMLALLARSAFIITDSGGVQKEAYLLGVPCITLRRDTEWPETVAAGWNTLTGVNQGEILAALSKARPAGERPAFFGDGRAAAKIAELLEKL